MTDVIEPQQSKSECMQNFEYLIACASRVVRWTKKSPYTQEHCMEKLKQAIQIAEGSLKDIDKSERVAQLEADNARLEAENRKLHMDGTFDGVAAEREACAKVAERHGAAWRTTVKIDNSHYAHLKASDSIAAAIRARGETSNAGRVEWPRVFWDSVFSVYRVFDTNGVGSLYEEDGPCRGGPTGATLTHCIERQTELHGPERIAALKLCGLDANGNKSEVNK